VDRFKGRHLSSGRRSKLPTILESRCATAGFCTSSFANCLMHARKLVNKVKEMAPRSCWLSELATFKTLNQHHGHRPYVNAELSNQVYQENWSHQQANVQKIIRNTGAAVRSVTFRASPGYLLLVLTSRSQPDGGACFCFPFATLLYDCPQKLLCPVHRHKTCWISLHLKG